MTRNKKGHETRRMNRALKKGIKTCLPRNVGTQMQRKRTETAYVVSAYLMCEDDWAMTGLEYNLLRTANLSLPCGTQRVILVTSNVLASSSQRVIRFLNG